MFKMICKKLKTKIWLSPKHSRFPFLFSIPLQIFKKRGVGRGGTNQSRVFQTLRLPIGQKNDLQKIENKFTGFSSALRRYP